MSALLAMALALARAPQDGVVLVGNWAISPTPAGECSAAASYGDHLMISIAEDSGGNGHFVLADDRWLLKDGDTKQAKFDWHSEWAKPVEADFTVHKMEKGTGFLLVAETGPWMTENTMGPKKFWLTIPGLDFDQEFDVADFADVEAALQKCNNG